MPSYHELETYYHTVLTYGEVKLEQANVMTGINMPNGDESCVAEMSRKRRKVGPSEIFHKSDLVLGLITDSLVADTFLERLISAVNVKYAALRSINNDNVKEKIAYKKVTFSKVVENSRHYVVKPERLARTINIGLNRAKK